MMDKLFSTLLLSVTLCVGVQAQTLKPIANLPAGIASATTSNLITTLAVPSTATVIPVLSTPLGSGYSFPMPSQVWLLVTGSVASNATFTATWAPTKNLNGTNYIATNNLGNFTTTAGLTNANQAGGVLLYMPIPGTNYIGADGFTLVSVGLSAFGDSTTNQQMWVSIPQ